jgi:MFS family permease
VARSGLFNVDAQRGLFSANTNSRYVWFVLGLTVIVQTVGSVVSQGIYTLVPFFRDEFGLNRSEAALAVTVMNAGQVVSMFWLGQATDRYGERAVVSSTMIGMGAAAVMGATLANSYVALLMALFSLGIFYASVQPGGTRAIVRWFPPQHRGLATGLRQAAVPLGTSIAAFTLPLIATAAGWRYAVLAQGLIGVAGGIFFWSCYRESMDLKDGAATVRLPVRALIKTLSEDAGFWLVLGGGVAMSAFQFTFTASAISFMTDHFKMDVLFAASLFAGAQIVGIPGRVLLPFVADRLWPGYRERVLGYIMSICVFVTVAYMLLPPDTPNWGTVHRARNHRAVWDWLVSALYPANCGNSTEGGHRFNRQLWQYALHDRDVAVSASLRSTRGHRGLPDRMAGVNSSTCHTVADVDSAAAEVAFLARLSRPFHTHQRGTLSC